MLHKIKFILILLFFSFYAIHRSNAQSKVWNCDGGFGLWEKFHAGIDIRFRNYSLGIGAGSAYTINKPGFKYYSITLENSYYWGRPNNDNLKRWYLDGRLVYTKQTTPQTTWKILFFCPSIGREFNFNSKNGITIDIGPAIVVTAHREDKPKTPMVGWIYPIYPEFKLEYFFRF